MSGETAKRARGGTLIGATLGVALLGSLGMHMLRIDGNVEIKGAVSTIATTKKIMYMLKDGVREDGSCTYLRDAPGQLYIEKQHLTRESDRYMREKIMLTINKIYKFDKKWKWMCVGALRK